jgi:hypothetical protein
VTLSDAREPDWQQLQWYHPGEIVVVARVPRGTVAAGPGDLYGRVHRTLRTQARAFVGDDYTRTRSFVFDAPGESRSLVFSFFKIDDDGSPTGVRDACAQLQDQLDAIGGPDVETIGVMPHWHTQAHEGYLGPSPASFPRPVYPDQVPQGWTRRFYQPINGRFDLAASAADVAAVPVTVLDTLPDLKRARDRATTFAREAHNTQLGETVDWVRRHSRLDRRYRAERADIATHHQAGRRAPDAANVADHGLFVSSLIHGLAPRAPITLEPALDDDGQGDLSLLLLGLERVLAHKRPEEPRVVNLSLGVRPHPARLPAAWYGLPRPQDPDYHPLRALATPGCDARWVATNRRRIGQTVDLLEAGLRELGRYLSLNNCLVVAAAGNDSLALVESRRARLEPRLPARFDTVLGVAATTSNPRQAARYSNVGDERELGDHIATFGGNASDVLEPEDGVIGVYAGEFPDGRPNETGWAFWSGTSFAAGIMSGLVATYWALRPELDAAAVLADLHAEATTFGPYVPALRTPAIEVRGRWGR